VTWQPIKVSKFSQGMVMACNLWRDTQLEGRDFSLGMVMIERGDKNIGPKLTNLITKTQEHYQSGFSGIGSCERTILPEIRISFVRSCHPLCWLFFINFRNRMGEIHVLRVQRTILPGLRTFLCVELSSSPLALFDLISKPQEGSTRASLLGMLVAGKGICEFPRQLQLPAFFSLLLRERASGRGGSFKDKLKRIWLQFAGAGSPCLVCWVSEHAEISAKRML
jgi:hypothetical protein